MKATGVIAPALYRHDDKSNKTLPDEIIRSGRYKRISEFVENLYNTKKDIRRDCIKVLYEIGERSHPEMTALYIIISL